MRHHTPFYCSNEHQYNAILRECEKMVGNEVTNQKDLEKLDCQKANQKFQNLGMWKSRIEGSVEDLKELFGDLLRLQILILDLSRPKINLNFLCISII